MQNFIKLSAEAYRLSC